MAADEILQHLHEASPGEQARYRETVICTCAPWARRLAARYINSSEPAEDLGQVALVGLVLAVDRYDPDRGIPFRHFALPTILGELRRHFRDRCWNVRVGRRTQELYQEVRGAEPDLAQRLGRTPTNADLADHLDLSPEDVSAARQGALAFRSSSLNAPRFDDDGEDEVGDRIGGLDPAVEGVVDHEALRRAVRLLPERLRLLLALRFYDELTQCQIADKLGISQMHVSRLLNRAFTLLRKHMDPDAPVEARGYQLPRHRRPVAA